PNVTLLPTVNAGGCTVSTVQVVSSPTLTGQTYEWFPGSLIGGTQTVQPLSTGVHTAAGTYSNICTVTETLSVPVPTNCCYSPGVNTFTASSISGSPAFTGPMKLPNSFTLQSGASLMMNGEFIISPNTSITVSSGAQLFLIGAHLYGCSDMWKGIVVQNGGKVTAQ